MTHLTIPVACVDCGRTLRAVPGVNGKTLFVRRHKRPDGSACFGVKRTDHRIIAAKDVAS